MEDSIGIRKSYMPFIAGVLMIIVLLIAFISGGSIFYHGEDVIGDVDASFDDNQVCGILLFIFGGILLVGSICAFKRVYWGVTLIASLIGILTIGPYYLGSILSVLALILLYLSRDKFGFRGKSSSYSPSPHKGESF